MTQDFVWGPVPHHRPRNHKFLKVVHLPYSPSTLMIHKGVGGSVFGVTPTIHPTFVYWLSYVLYGINISDNYFVMFVPTISFIFVRFIIWFNMEFNLFLLLKKTHLLLNIHTIKYVMGIFLTIMLAYIYFFNYL